VGAIVTGIAVGILVGDEVVVRAVGDAVGDTVGEAVTFVRVGDSEGLDENSSTLMMGVAIMGSFHGGLYSSAKNDSSRFLVFFLECKLLSLASIPKYFLFARCHCVLCACCCW